jgi:hypothetical protein
MRLFSSCGIERKRAVRMGWMSLENCTAREADAGSVECVPALALLAATFAAVVPSQQTRRRSALLQIDPLIFPVLFP